MKTTFDLDEHLIARQFSGSGKTVKTHVGRIFAKLGVRDRAPAVVAAHESDLVVPGAGDRESTC